ncbi:MAG: hypothetical protein WCB15_24050, partial [Desulfobacterales bacterium]
ALLPGFCRSMTLRSDNNPPPFRRFKDQKGSTLLFAVRQAALAMKDPFYTACGCTRPLLDGFVLIF